MGEIHELVLSGRGPNTLSLASLEHVWEVLEAAGDGPVLVRGAGAAFSAGLDLDALIGTDPAPLLDRIEQVARRLFLHAGPTVACVNGHAVAGGCLLALACDHRVGARDPALRMGMTGVALGIAYPPGVLRLLRARLPVRSVTRVLLGAERFGPEEALALGLLDELAEDPYAVARAHLARLATHPRAAYAETKRALREDLVEVPEAERVRFTELVEAAWDPSRLRARFKV